MTDVDVLIELHRISDRLDEIADNDLETGWCKDEAAAVRGVIAKLHDGA